MNSGIVTLMPALSGILLGNPAFVAYVVAAIVLTVNLLALWNFSGVTRMGTQTTINPEDAVTVVKGAAVVGGDPPEVARVLRAHHNAFVNITPFQFLGLLYVLIGASPTLAYFVFGLFTVCRLLHSVAYVKGLQPWRTLSYIVSNIAVLVMVIDMIRLLVA